MNLLDNFTFLIESDEDEAVSGLEKAGKAFDELKKKGESGSASIAESMGDAGADIGHTAIAVESDLEQMGTAAMQAGVDFIEMALKASGANADVSASFAQAVNEVVRDNRRMIAELNKLGDVKSPEELVEQLEQLGPEFKALAAQARKMFLEVEDSAEPVPPKINKITEALRLMGIEIDADKFGKSVKGFLAAAAAAMTYNAVMEKTAQLMGRITDAETIGMDVSNYDAMSKTFGTLNVEADEFRDSMIDLNEALGEAADDAESQKAKSFKNFGIALRDSQGNIKQTDIALLELADSMSKMTKQQATFEIKQLGITDNKVIAAMMKGRGELERLIGVQKEHGVLTKEDAEKIKTFNTALSAVGVAVGNAGDKMMVMLAPAMTWIAEVAGDATQSFGSFLDLVNDNLPFFISLLSVMGAAVLPTLMAALWGVATAAWAAIAPFLPFIAIAVLTALVIDDLWNYFTGGESVIGGLADKFPILKSALEGIRDVVTTVYEAFKQFFDYLSNTAPAQIIDDVANTMGAGWEKVKGMFGFESAVAANDAVSNAVSAPVIPAGVGGNSNVTTTNQTTIQVNGAKDPSAVANEVVGHMPQNSSSDNGNGRSH